MPAAQIPSNAANGLPSWYQTEADEAAAQAALTQAAPNSAGNGSQASPYPNATPLPDDVVLDGQTPYDVAQQALAKKNGQPYATPLPDNVVLDGKTPDWYSPEAGYGSANGQPNQAPSVTANLETGLLRVPGAVIGAPRTVEHAVDWAYSKAANAAGALVGHNPNLTADDVDNYNILQRVLPSQDAVNNKVFSATGVTPYNPQTWQGQIGQAAVTGLGAGLLDPMADASAANSAEPLVVAAAKSFWGRIPSAVKTALAASAAQGSQQLAPDTPGLAAAAALATHAGASGIGAMVRGGGGVTADTLRQTFSPEAQGRNEAGRVLTSVNNSQPGLANPTDTDIAGATGNVAAATQDIGPGQQPWMAGANLRSTLQQRVNTLEQARDDATAPLRTARDTSPNLVNVDPVLAVIDKGLGVAAGAQQSALQGARSDLYLNDGTLRDQPDQLAASRQAINARISDATRAGDNASASHLLAVRNALDTQINDAVPAAGAYTSKYAEMSQPLDPMQYGAPAKVLDRDQFNTRYTFPDERVPDLFLRSQATRSDLNQLIAAHGSDRDAALGSLQDHLAGVAQSAVNPDGTLDAGAFNKAMAPYQRSLGNVGVFFPELNQKFNTAQAAQGTLDTMQAQKGIVSDINSGALRDNSGAVTGASFNKWLQSNQPQLAKTQTPAAVMRLQSMAGALQGAAPGEVADALKSELLPAAVGMATGGLEAGVLGTLLHKSVKTMFGGLDQRRQEAFANAMEQATTNPSYAAQLATNAAKAQGISPARALVRAVATTPLAVNAGIPPGNNSRPHY